MIAENFYFMWMHVSGQGFFDAHYLNFTDFSDNIPRFFRNSQLHGIMLKYTFNMLNFLLSAYNFYFLNMHMQVH